MPPSTSSVRVKDEAQPSPSSSATRIKGKSSGQLTANEKRIWQAVYDAPNHSMTLARIERQFCDLSVEKRSAVVNSLTAKSMLSMQVLNGKLHQFIAATRAEASIIGQLEEIESMVYSHIRDCGNEGIWTKNLKLRTNVHQTSLARVLKALEGKNLIKAVKSVKFPTRKIYMLYNLQPSVELSGGPWYTDNELDTAFINQLCNVLHKYIASMTWPKRTFAGEKDQDRPIYPASHIHNLPSATQCRKWLSKLNVTSTQLEESDIESLLDVLVYDGKIDKIPFAKVESSPSNSRRRRGSDEWTGKNKRDGYESQSDESEIAVLSPSDSESDSSRKKRKRRSSKQSEGRKKGRDSYSTAERQTRRSDDEDESNDDEGDEDDEGVGSGGTMVTTFVYRALRDIQMEPGWTEVTCAHCPVFDFCSPGGPVNAEGCLYMREWIPRNKSLQARRLLEDSYHENGITDVGYEDDSQMANGGGATSGEEDNPASLGAPSSPVVAQDDIDDDDYGGEEI